MTRSVSRAVAVPVSVMMLVIAVFTMVYRLMGVEKHFEVTEEQRGRPWFTSFYISCMAFTNAMGDAAPKTIPGRYAFLAQVMVGFAVLLLGDNLV